LPDFYTTIQEQYYYKLYISVFANFLQLAKEF